MEERFADEGQGSIKRYRVPFSVRELWEGGCDGDSWWFDRYGKEFSLLVSGNGAAYVCPSDPGEGWRIYSNPRGRAFKLTGWPARGRVYHSEDATEEMGKILACALMTIDDIAPVICRVATGRASLQEPHLPITIGGMDVPLAEEGWRRWRLVLDSGEIKVLCQDREIAVDAVPVVAERFDGTRRSASAGEVGHALSLLRAGRVEGGVVQQAAIDIAVSAFECAWETMKSIERFDSECGGIKQTEELGGKNGFRG